jgi:tetratricopeptide (TPR) repeat protein
MNFVKRWSEGSKRARRLVRADRLRETGDLRGALAEYEAALRDEPNNARVVREVAELRALTGQPEAAVEALCALLEINLEEMAFIGNTAFDAIRPQPGFLPVFDTVVMRLRAHLDAHPDDLTARFSLAEAFEMRGDPNGAFAVYDDLIENNDTSVRARALYAKARLALATGRNALAATHLQAAFDANPNLLSVYETDVAFGETRGESDFRDAYAFGVERRFESLRVAIENDPQNPVPCRQLLDLLTAQGRLDEAVALALQASERMPDELAFPEHIANAHFAAGRYDQAFDTYQDILRRNPHHLWALYRSGVVYERRHQRAAALESYVDALSELRNEPDVALLLARGFARLNDADSALEALEQAVELSSQSEIVTPDLLLEAIETCDDWGTLSTTDDFLSVVALLRERLADNAPVDDADAS